MVGRGAVRRPWIFAEAREMAQSGLEPRGKNFTDTVFEEIGLRFLELLSRYQPPEFHISRVRRFFFFFFDNLKWWNYLKNLLNREESLGGIERVWRNYFSGNTGLP
jgi:tRNA-dihydrouridine synthase